MAINDYEPNNSGMALQSIQTGAKNLGDYFEKKSPTSIRQKYLAYLTSNPDADPVQVAQHAKLEESHGVDTSHLLPEFKTGQSMPQAAPGAPQGFQMPQPAFGQYNQTPPSPMQPTGLDSYAQQPPASSGLGTLGQPMSSGPGLMAAPTPAPAQLTSAPAQAPAPSSASVQPRQRKSFDPNDPLLPQTAEEYDQFIHAAPLFQRGKSAQDRLALGQLQLVEKQLEEAGRNNRSAADRGSKERVAANSEAGRSDRSKARLDAFIKTSGARVDAEWGGIRERAKEASDRNALLQQRIDQNKLTEQDHVRIKEIENLRGQIASKEGASARALQSGTREGKALAEQFNQERTQLMMHLSDRLGLIPIPNQDGTVDFYHPDKLLKQLGDDNGDN